MRVNLLLGGPIIDWPNCLKKDPQSIPGEWLGVDRGTLRLLDIGVTPKLAVGDFDSLTTSELKRVQDQVDRIHYAKPEKDDTDSELGLKLAIQILKADTVVIYGATGGRLDHFLVNLLMILEPRFHQFAPYITMVDRQNTLTFYLPGQHIIKKEPGKKYLAFVNLEPVTDFSITDAKYTLKSTSLNYLKAYASNEFKQSEVHFSFDSGLICAIQSKDKQENSRTDTQ